MCDTNRTTTFNCKICANSTHRTSRALSTHFNYICSNSMHRLSFFNLVMVELVATVSVLDAHFDKNAGNLYQQDVRMF